MERKDQLINTVCPGTHRLHMANPVSEAKSSDAWLRTGVVLKIILHFRTLTLQVRKLILILPLHLLTLFNGDSWGIFFSQVVLFSFRLWNISLYVLYLNWLQLPLTSNLLFSQVRSSHWQCMTSCLFLGHIWRKRHFSLKLFGEVFEVNGLRKMYLE